MKGLLALATWSRASSAEIDSARDVASRVQDQWRAAGAEVATLPARFLFDDQSIIVPLPAAPPGAPCTRVGLVGSRGLGFRAKLSDASNDPLAPEATGRAVSSAGVMELERCDPRRPVRYIVISSDSGRGALEIVVAHARAGLPSLGSVAPERTGGPLPKMPDAGALPPLVPEGKRADAAEARATRDGAQVLARRTFQASDDGSGENEIDLEPGCHRIEIFGRDPRTDRSPRRFRLDLDAELRDPDGDRVLARDRTEAADAHLETCVGRPTRVSLVFVGAVPRSDVTVSTARWPLPNRLPALWGPLTRAKMARAMLTRHVAIPADDPIFLGQGASGTTTFPLPVEIGGCYVAVVGLARGSARTLALRAHVGTRASSDERGASEEAALTAFCVKPHERARVEVHLRGSAVAFGLAVYRVKSEAWESVR